MTLYSSILRKLFKTPWPRRRNSKHLGALQRTLVLQPSGLRTGRTWFWSVVLGLCLCVVEGLFPVRQLHLGEEERREAWVWTWLGRGENWASEDWQKLGKIRKRWERRFGHHVLPTSCVINATLIQLVETPGLFPVTKISPDVQVRPARQMHTEMHILQLRQAQTWVCTHLVFPGKMGNLGGCAKAQF